MSIFLRGNFGLHGGQKSAWKIDCDALTDADWETLALMLVEKLPSFHSVMGIPRGGLKLGAAIRKYSVAHRVTEAEPHGRLLIVDDVLTTGSSMETARGVVQSRYPFLVIGAVVFARGPCPPWVTPLFRMT